MSASTLSASDRQRYQRHLALPGVGEAGQQRLAHSSVLIVGAGGLGAPAALYLAAAGVGRIGLIDHDHVELGNLQRQVLYRTDDVGAPKVAAAAAQLAALNPGIDVVPHDDRFSARNAAATVAPYDVVLDGTDRLAVRYTLNDACVLGGKPLVSCAIHRFEGLLTTFLPGRGPCYRCLYPDAGPLDVPGCAEAGVLGVLPGVMGLLQATEVLKLLLGIGEVLDGRLLTYDALAMRFGEIAFERRADCAVCGEHPTITHLPAGDEDDMIEEWSASELATRLAGEDAASLLLVDVREPFEWNTGHLPGAVHIPLGALPARAGEIPAGRTPVFICAVGGRSMAACRHFAGLGRPAVNLAGGVTAWRAASGAWSHPPGGDTH